MTMKRSYADGPFGQIHFKYADQGKPLILLHQAIMDSGQFDHVIEPLIARDLRPIAIDLPGFGQSDQTLHPPTIADYSRAIMPVLDALGILRAGVAGHHTGALIATEVALSHAERIDAVVLAGPMIISEEERRAGFIDLVDKEKEFAAKANGAHFAEVAKIREMLSNGSIGPDRISEYVVQAMAAYHKGAYWYGHNAAFTYRHEEPLKKITQPTLLLTNTGDVTHPYAQAAYRLRPDFDWFEIEGGGIDICDQQPLVWANAIADFLDLHAYQDR